jgi:hypothetical protein
VTTADHDVDWFVVAPDPQSAAHNYEQAEGYDEGEATAEFVCSVPTELGSVPVGSPDDELLEECGAVIVPGPTGPRIVRLAGKVFIEGDLAGNVVARQGLLFKN